MAGKRRPAKNLIVLEPSEHNERLNPDLVGESLNIIPAYTGAVDTDKADVFIRINQKVAGILIRPDFDFAVHGVEVNELCRVVTIDDMGYLMKEREPERVSACSAQGQAEYQLVHRESGPLSNKIFDKPLDRSAPEIPDHIEPDAAFRHNALKLLHPVGNPVKHQGFYFT